MSIRLEDLTSAEIFRVAIDRWVNFRASRDDNVIWITEIAGCLRRAYLDRVEPAQFSGKQSILMFFGEAVHRLLADVIPRTIGDVFDFEVEARYGIAERDDVITIVGRADMVTKDRKVVIEVKTIGEIYDDPLPPHVKQLQYYMNILGAEHGVLLYISRDGDMRAFYMKRDKDYLDEMEARARALYYSLKYRRAPRAERAPYNCNGCIFMVLGKCIPKR